MTSPSARASTARPFYDVHADVYDLLVTDPVEPWVDAVDDALRAAGHDRADDRADVLDAGCGTGRHAAALLARGHRVTLVDASPRLLALARRRCPDAPATVGDVCALGLHESADAVACRGVLNDLLTDEERSAALSSFAAALRPGGVLVLDVREAAAARIRADGVERITEVDLPDGGRLRFTSRPTWQDGRIVVDERHVVTDAGGRVTTEHRHTFTMRPWTGDELTAHLTAAGLTDVTVRPGVGRRTADRLLVTARTP
ncbi:class I SAM-dependent DNA methyltransferase [Phycicoccus flavus]|uniref:Class I SAM-dependent methyltransferase n=1 Tax=Phycicoccus flavus TaxID=2502783 RepID=A0A8T6RDM4_9MICO|nr:class I SAM-dependent methyltransferase [Phycicoccus flavus]NHA70271.1 class I SAM-dependent methyltransferase [Phycicoccus flavus]